MGKYQKFYDEYGKNAPIWQKRLCERMTELNINQEELAKACGVSKSAVGLKMVLYQKLIFFSLLA